MADEKRIVLTWEDVEELVDNVCEQIVHKFENKIRPLGKYITSEGQIFNPDIPRAVTIRDAFAEYHQKYAKLIVTLKKPHREETSEEIKFNTSLRHKIKETE